MQKKLKGTRFILLIGLILGMIMLQNCTKEGPPGLAGLNGEDGTQTCGECHNMSEFLNAKISQYNNSIHASGNNVDRSYQPCAQCHTSMGFRNYLTDGEPVPIENPTPINCRTCHPVHETFTMDDFAIRTTDSVHINVGDVTYDYGTSNLCVNCHQARNISPYPDIESNDSVTVNSPYYGPHHSTQANMFMAEGPIKIPGTMPYLNSAHKKMVEGGCVTCHMSPATGVKAGGHQMNVKYVNSHGADSYQYTGCLATDCHGSDEEISGLIDPNRIEIHLLEDSLKSLLTQRGVLDYRGLVPAPKTMSQIEAAALVNYKFVHGDYSSGAHNFRFTKALLNNSIEALEN